MMSIYEHTAQLMLLQPRIVQVFTFESFKEVNSRLHKESHQAYLEDRTIDSQKLYFQLLEQEIAAREAALQVA